MGSVAPQDRWWGHCGVYVPIPQTIDETLIIFHAYIVNMPRKGTVEEPHEVEFRAGRKWIMTDTHLISVMSGTFLDALEEEFGQSAVAIPVASYVFFAKRKYGILIAYLSPDDFAESKLTVTGKGVRKADIEKLKRAFKKGRSEDERTEIADIKVTRDKK